MITGIGVGVGALAGFFTGGSLIDNEVVGALGGAAAGAILGGIVASQLAPGRDGQGAASVVRGMNIGSIPSRYLNVAGRPPLKSFIPTENEPAARERYMAMGPEEKRSFLEQRRRESAPTETT